MSVPLTGVVQGTGEHDTGKTTFALECGVPAEDIGFFDDDLKGRATVKELLKKGTKFGCYHDLVKIGEGKRELEFYSACMRLLETIKPDQFQVLVWDTWTRFQSTLHSVVLSDKRRFRLNWRGTGEIIGAMEYQEAFRLEAEILGHLQELAELVILLTHLKDHRIEKVKTGKEIPASSRTLARVPRLRIWLRHNPQSPVPIGLCLKRLDKKYQENGKIRTMCVLPRKITPLPDERSLWDSIERYMNNPVGLRPPTPEETPDEFELSILDGILTREQKHTLELMLSAGAVSPEEFEPETSEANPETEAMIKELLAQGLGPAEIAAKVEGATIQDICQVRRANESL